MAGNSSSSTVDLRDRNTNETDTYNLQNWQGLTAVLKMGKDALPDAGEYGAFRNLVLQYAQRGGDVELKKKIVEAISRFGKPQEVVVAEAVPSATPDSVPLQKNTSDFLPHAVVESEAHETAGETPVGAPVKSSQLTRRLPPRFATVSTEETSRVSGAPKVQNAAPSFIVNEVVVKEAVTPQVTESVEESSRAEAEPVQETPPAAQLSIEEHKARITEIKHSVHTHFGNPAALVDMRSDAGKGYMKALLSALKAVGPGSDADANGAMRELESAYAKLIEENKSHTPIPEVREVPVRAAEPALASIPESIPEVVTPIEISPYEFEPVAAEVPAEVLVAPKPEVTIDIEEFPTEAVAETIDVPTEIAVEQSVESKFSAKNTLAQLSSRRSEYNAQTTTGASQSVLHDSAITTQARGAISQNKHTLRGLAKVAGDHKLGYQPVVNHEEVVVKQSELVSEEITSALRTLLHDWSLFAGSGLFGTGPSGIEHPLYQQLAPLSMGEVIAGRWNHSDPKVTKTIKEYVDAWRHEQGIAFTTNETFEHYLRRVIQRILKRQTA